MEQEHYNPVSVLHPDMTPCISPLPQDGHLQDKSCPSLGLIQEETDGINSIMGNAVLSLFVVLYEPTHVQLVHCVTFVCC